MENNENTEKMTLIEALDSRNRDAIRECLDRLDELSQEDKNVSLSYICSEGAVDLAQQLLSAGADINNTMYRGTTPLLCALLSKQKECAEMLFDKGADPSITIDLGPVFIGVDAKDIIAPVELAIGYGFEDLAAKIIDSDKNYWGDCDLSNGLDDSITHGYKDLFAKMLPKATNLNMVANNKKTLLIIAMEMYKKTRDSFFFDILVEDKRVDINYRSPMYGTPLEYAIRNMLSVFARRLIEKGADLKATGKDGMSVMHIAADNGDTAMVQYLMTKGMSVNIRNKEDETPFMYAVAGDHKDTVSALAKAGAKINVQSRDGMTPLMLSLLHKNLAIASWLLKNKADLYPSDSRGWAALRYAAVAGNTAIIEQMLRFGDANPNKHDNDYVTPIMTAARHGTLEAVKMLIGYGAEISSGDDKERTPLIYAATASRQMLNLLLLRGADINAKDQDGWTALHYAVLYENINNVKLLIQKGAEVNVATSDGEYPLHIVTRNATRESYDIANLLMEYNAERAGINKRDKKGNTPLMLAIRNEDRPLVKSLLDNGADTEIPNAERETPLMVAVNIGNKDIISYLLDARADINARDKEGHTALMFASANPNLMNIVDILVKNGADVNARDKEGMTALMYACLLLNSDAVSYLVKYGKADLSIKDNEGNVAEYHANVRLSVIAKALRSEEIDEKDQKKIKKGNIGFDLSGDDEPKKKKQTAFEDRD